MRYRNNIVRIGQGNAPSGRLLRQRLESAGFTGHINWGYIKAQDGLNNASAIKLASNKKKALQTMYEAGVPIPRLYTGPISGAMPLPVIGRTSYHRGGSGFWFCDTGGLVYMAGREGATHFTEYIANAREFRVHIVDGQSIKISEKALTGAITGNRANTGAWFYPHRFKRKISLRKVAKQAVAALGLDFGAVDILYKKVNGEPHFYVLEVNCCPALTDAKSDTLDRYITAFKELDV